MTEGYCVKCRSKKEMEGAKEISMKAKGGKTRMAMTGSCLTCKTKIFRIMGMKK